MEIGIVVPTRNRLDKLLRMVESAKSTKHKLHFTLIEDGSEKLATHGWNYDQVTTLVTGDHVGSVTARNDAVRYCLRHSGRHVDMILLAVDDIVFLEGSIDHAVRSLRTKFPKRFGAVGFRILLNEKTHNSGVVLVWSDLAEAFPNGKLFFPGYWHFAAQEFKTALRRLKLMYEDNEALIEHYHPRRCREEMDGTHRDARKRKQKDTGLWKERKSKKMLWGMKEVRECLARL